MFRGGDIYMDLTKLHLHWGSSQHKGKCYRSYSLARAYRKDGKNRKEIILKLGKLSEQEVTHWQELLQAAKNPDAFFTTIDNISIDNHLAYLDIAAISNVWDEWKLDDAFGRNAKKSISTANIARILTINRSTDPQSKSQTPKWYRKTILPWLLNVSPDSVNASRIFRELSCVEKDKESLCNHIFYLLQQKNPQSMSNIFYDLSSTTFTGSKCILMKWGYCKEGYKNHVVLAIVVNQNGLPFYWEVLPGGTADVTTITWLLKSLDEKFTLSGTTVVFDRGMVSDDNLSLLEKSDTKYISAMDKNQIEKITGINFVSSFSHLDVNRISEQIKVLPNFIQMNNTTYYREINSDEERRYILCLNQTLVN